jgi:hypothetical protein
MAWRMIAKRRMRYNGGPMMDAGADFLAYSLMDAKALYATEQAEPALPTAPGRSEPSHAAKPDDERASDQPPHKRSGYRTRRLKAED